LLITAICKQLAHFVRKVIKEYKKKGLIDKNPRICPDPVI